MRAVGAWGVPAWILLLSGVVGLVYATVRPIDGAAAAPRSMPARPASVSVPYSAESLSHVVTSRDVFRAGRRPSAVGFDPLRSDQPLEAPLRPVLALVGIVAGREPSAVIEGFPGVEGGRVVRVGDVVAGLLVQRIAPGGVRVVGMDTVWVLTVREPWR